ncbi:MAG: c-type cytochrome biogenesis protein CcsB, partial [Thermodesulfobacteriota bacterium]
MPNSEFIISVTTFTYGLALVFYIAGWIFKKETPGRLGTTAMIAAGAGNTAGFFLRWAETYEMGYSYVP